MTTLSSFFVGFALLSVGHAVRNATDEEFPFQVSIQDSDINRHICGGAIITSKWVLTSRDCLTGHRMVTVLYGSQNANKPLGKVNSAKIYHQNEFLNINKNLALIELEKELPFSSKVKQVSLPQKGTPFSTNKTKLSAWSATLLMPVQPSLMVIDKYTIMTDSCKLPGGTPIELEQDEFCGMEDESPNYATLKDVGMIVSKAGVALGLLPDVPTHSAGPSVFVKLSDNAEWINQTLGDDRRYISWVTEIPKDSAASLRGYLVLLAIVTVFIHL